jgi:hypothetical protein
LYFKKLNLLIMGHYRLMSEHRTYCASEFQRDFVEEWQSHLLQEIKLSLASAVEDLVVEGYLLYDCRNEVEASLATDAQVFTIHVQDRRYTWERRVISIAEVAALGAPN